MKRAEAISKINEFLDELATSESQITGKEILDFIELKLKMQPPLVDNEKSSAIDDVYVFPHYYMWDEEFNNDERLVKRLAIRKSWKQK